MPRSLTTHLQPGWGARLKEARERAGLSQRQLSFPGCTAAYISRIEKNDGRRPSLQMVHELANRTGCDPDWLATGKRPKRSVTRAQYETVVRERDILAERLREIQKLSKP